MKNLIKAPIVVVGLLFAVASCSSDSKSDSSTAGTTAETVASDATGDSAVTEETETGGTAVAELGPLQQKLVDDEVTFAASKGLTYDADCFAGITAQLSDADAQLLIDSGADGSTAKLSPEGTALELQIIDCFPSS